jgi:beta-glucosidase
MNKIFNMESYERKAREAVAEGLVLLRNEGNVLPLQPKAKAAVFGRNQFHYYKSGTGSGGLVNTNHIVSILEALEEELQINPRVREQYEEWLKEYPFDVGSGWASEPWFQEEMPMTQELVDTAAKESDIAIIMLGRTSGEDRDNKAEEGSYYLTQTEREMLRLVCGSFGKTVVLLNTGNIIDMKWVNEYRPEAVLYVWQGGQEGGKGTVDVLMGKVSPSGKMTNTIAQSIDDYPAAENFGDESCNRYEEDIYVGYRYFETFARDKVVYPFGFGLSYTVFLVETERMEVKEDTVCFYARVMNTGNCPGKEVVQVYCEAPQGRLGKASRSLCGYAKTKTLNPGECEVLTIHIPKYYLSAYDDSGITGHKSCYVLEEGEYVFYMGTDVRSAVRAESFQLPDITVLEQLKEAMAPVVHLNRIKPKMQEGKLKISYEQVPVRTVDLKKRIEKYRPAEVPYTGDKGFKLWDVSEGRVGMKEIIAQFSDEELFCIVRGEGMCSPKVTPGTAGAFGGVTQELLYYGIPTGCCADGPSGIRMDCGTLAFSMPNGTCLACTFNEELVKELYEFAGLELRKNHIDTLLGPGMNLHRHPLNGRNFEYFSEDPLLTGRMAVAQLKGMHKYRVTGTIKHFACNNQEYKRDQVETIISERALRELYLKGFEIAVKEGEAYSIMSTYGPVNGFWTASNYDLLTTILREEWKFKGLVMTDWWAKGNEEGEQGLKTNIVAMIRSQNDLYMVTNDSKGNSNCDNAREGLAKGAVTRAEFQRSAANILRVLMKLPALERLQGIKDELEEQLVPFAANEGKQEELHTVEVTQDTQLDISLLPSEKGKRTLFQITLQERGVYILELTMRSRDENDLAQIPLSVFVDAKLKKTLTLAGKDRDWITESVEMGPILNNTFYLKLYLAQSGMEIQECRIKMVQSLEEVLRK